MMDMVRINHGLQPKHNSKLPPSGAALMAAKLGVVEQNKRRQILFREREQQLFEVVKKLWNAHWDGEKGAQLFTEDAELEIHYIDPEFSVDPQTKATTTKMRQDILFAGNHDSIKSMYPHLDEEAIKELISKSHDERMQQAERDAEVEAAKVNKMRELGVEVELTADGKMKTIPSAPAGETKQSNPIASNPAKHAEQSAIQPGRNGDGRKSDKTKRAEKQNRKESGFEED